jgi:6-phosphogluconolactonase
MDPERDRLAHQKDVAIAGGPSPLAFSQKEDRAFLYAGLRASCEIASLAVDRRTGQLSQLGKIALTADPCYMSTDRTGRYLLASYYGAGKVTVHPIGSDGIVRAPPVASIATAPKAHSIQTDRGNRFAFVPHVGESNVILQFSFDARTGQLTPTPEASVHPEAGTGPRHYCFHPHLDVVYVVNEQGCSVSAYDFSPTAGTLVHAQTLSTLPPDFAGPNTCAQIHITPSGRALYAANRGHDSIACFALETGTGRLSVLGHQPTERTPRAFAVSPGGEYLFVTGNASGRMTTYRIDAQTGALRPLDVYRVGERPMWVLPVALAT